MPVAVAEEERWWSEKTIALVTGANKGIGLQLVREFSKRGITTILTSRNEAMGKKAAERLKREAGLSVAYHQLDVSVPSSVQELVNWLAAKYGGLDILINNAGICSVPGCITVDYADRVEAARSVLGTNYYGVKRMIEEVIPIMKPGGRIINISSKCGDLSYLKNNWRATLDDISNLTDADIDQCLEQLIEDVAQDQIIARGWPVSEVSFSGNVEHTADYGLSKMAVNAYTRIKALELSGQGKKVSVNCVCPGLTSTEMVKYYGHPVEIGADTAVWLALLPFSELPSGQFFTGRTNVGFTDMPFYFKGELMDFATALKHAT